MDEEVEVVEMLMMELACVPVAAPAAITGVIAAGSRVGEPGAGGVPDLVHEPPQGGGGDLDDGLRLTPSWFSRGLARSSVFSGTQVDSSQTGHTYPNIQ